MATIDEFKGNFTDLARPNRYRVNITGPIAPPPTLNLMCKGTSLPGISLATFEHNLHGPQVQLPYRSIIEDFEMEFYLDDNHTERNFFLDWFDYICNPVSKKLEFFRNYASTITIHQQNRANQDIFVARLIDTYPTNIGDVRLSYEEEDTVETCTITFFVRDWQRS